MPSRRSDIPTYSELLDRTDAPPGSSWGVFGADDQLGTLNFLTEETAAHAARLVRAGRTYNLDYPLNTFVPSLSGTRPASEHSIFANGPNHRDDWLDSFYLQSTTQIDGWRHMRDPIYGFYGGVQDDLVVVDGPDLGIQLAAEKGIFARGVLVDLPRYFESIGRAYDPMGVMFIGPEDLDAALAFHGVRWETGDVLVLRTGWSSQYLGMTKEQQAEHRKNMVSPGLDQSREILAYLWDNQISMAVSDNIGVEAIPVRPDSVFFDANEPKPNSGMSHNGMLHRPVIALLGLLLGECWNLDDLADACAADGRYEFLLTAKPLDLIGAVGSPANAMAVK
jgi:hypothetical protein